jgi:4-hydroxybenzoate polyprenyltransferase
LCRLDVLAIAFVSHLIGVRLARPLALFDLVTASLLALVSTNAIYSLNAWADRDTDRISKPYRPIPAGRISPASALRYSIVVLVLSVIYPFALSPNLPSLMLFLLLPFLAVSYSVPPLRIKTKPWLAVATTAVGLTVPCQLGYLMNRREPQAVVFFLGVILFCFGVVCLKDIDDAQADAATGIANLYQRHGRVLLSWAAVATALAGILIGLVPTRPAFKAFSPVCLLVAGYVWLAYRSAQPPGGLYDRVIRLSIALMCAFYIGLHILGSA